MISIFKIKENVELFTTYDYKRLIDVANTHFLFSCTKQGIDVVSSCAYFNPEINQGCVVYEFSNFNGSAEISEVEFPLADSVHTIEFE